MSESNEPKIPWAPPSPGSENAGFSTESVHDLLQQQIAGLLEDAEISEEQKQSILVAINCPCCGAGGMSLSIKLKKDREFPPAY